ncbi:MAG: glycosyltransferase [Lutibacter sp.]|uniref:glycosyltransferase n=1 Tax=Lutibacter sp. TaxID=1925666 RepID=UPI00385E1DE5
MKQIIVSVTNDLVNDQRVHKVCTTLTQANYDVLLIGRKLKTSKNLKRDYKTYRFQLLFKKGFLFYAEYNLRLFIKLLFIAKKNNILLSNDLDTLLPNFMMSKLLQIPLVFDSHELFSELPSIRGRYSQKVWRFLENWLVPKQKYFFTVSGSIANWFYENYGVKPLVLKNFPRYKNTPFKEAQHKYILYQGSLNKGRGLLALIKAMQTIEIPLKIAGEGPYKSKIEKKIIELKLENKVLLLGNLDPEKLVLITQNATLGISLEEDLGLSYRYSLPNKLFDYIQAKTPVLATYLPEIKNVVESYKVGEIIEDHSPKNIVKGISKILENGKYYYQLNLEEASKELIWENQEKMLLSFFRNI